MAKLSFKLLLALTLLFAFVTLSEARVNHTNATKKSAAVKAKPAAAKPKPAAAKRSCANPQQTTTSSPDRSMSNVSKATMTLVAYDPAQYKDLKSFYKAWRLKCIAIVGPRNQHHQVSVQPGKQSNTVFVYCGGMPKDDDGKWSKANGPTVDTTMEEIRKMNLTCP